MLVMAPSKANFVTARFGRLWTQQTRAVPPIATLTAELGITVVVGQTFSER